MNNQTTNKVETLKQSVLEYQVNPPGYKGVRYQIKENDFLNSHQNFLFHRAMYGLSIYTQEEINSMNWEKRKRIIKVHKRTQAVLNQWKQEIVINMSNALFSKYFGRSPFTQTLLSLYSNTEKDFKCTLDFKSFKITKSMIVKKLFEKGIFPTNFYQLNQEVTF
jgi:hypothetical protein